MHENDTVYITTTQLCDHFNVSRQAVDRWRKEGMPFVMLGPKTIRYEIDEVLEYFKSIHSKRAEKVGD